MFAVIELGSEQYKVKEGDVIYVNRLEQEPGAQMTIEKVLLFENGADVQIGQPYLENVTVEAKVEKQTLGTKVVAFKYRRRKDSAVKKGHRQKLSAVSITKINV